MKNNNSKVSKLCEQNQSLANEAHTLQCKLDEEVNKTIELKTQTQASIEDKKIWFTNEGTSS